MSQIRKYSNYIGVVGCVLLLIGNFFTFFTVEGTALGVSHSKSVNFIEGDGVFIIVAAIVAAIFIYMKKGKWNYVPAFISAAIAIYDVIQANNNANSVKLGFLVKIEVQYGIGFFMIILGAIAVAAYAFLYKEESEEMQLLDELGI